MTGTSSKGRRDYRVEGHGAANNLSTSGSGVKFTGPFTSVVSNESETLNLPAQNLFKTSVAGETLAWTHT